MNYFFLKHKVVLIFLVLFSINTFSQTDTEFWFAAPDVANTHGPDGRPLYLNLSAINNTTITLSRPADSNFTTRTYNLLAGQSKSILMDRESGATGILPLDSVECYADRGVEVKGFKIEANPGKITAVYEMGLANNRDFLPLKGRNALGTEFTVTTQNLFPNQTSAAWSGFVVVATRDNTVVHVNLPFDYVNYTAGLDRTVILNEGETYNFQIDSFVNSKQGLYHPQGVKVWTTGPNPAEEYPIAISIYDDSMYRINNVAPFNGGCYDIFADQIVPEALFGREYLVLKGWLTNRQEYVFITAIQDNTVITIDGVLTTTLNKGEVYPYQIVNKATQVASINFPITVNHVTGFGCEQGGAILPPMDGCTGSHDVTIARFTEGANEAFPLNIMVRNDTTTGSPNKNKAVTDFWLDVNGIDYHIPKEYFNYTTDSVYAYLIDDNLGSIYNYFASRIPPANPPTVATISNHTSRFHLGVVHGGATSGCKYGYFSDYGSTEPDAGLEGASARVKRIYCDLDPIHLVAAGGEKYLWKCTSNPDLTTDITDVTIADPYFTPDTAGIYDFEVQVFGECFTDTTLKLTAYVVIGPTSNFTLSETEGCAPFVPELKNTTDLQYAQKLVWKFSPPGDEFDQPLIQDYTFNHTFDNNSDTIKTFTIGLYSYALSGVACPDVKEVDINVYPQVEHIAGFNVTSDTGNCNEITYSFENTTSGTGLLEYEWDLGDGSNYSTSGDFEHSYIRDLDNNKQLTVELTVTGEHGCTDIDTKEIEIPQSINAEFVPDSDRVCSQSMVNFINQSSGDPDIVIYKWSVDTLVGTSENFQTKFINHSIDKDTVYSALLVASDNEFCWDTASLSITVVPAPIADFSVEQTEGCSPFTLKISNQSIGAESYAWFIDEAEVSAETSPNIDMINNIGEELQKYLQLNAISTFGCVDTFVTTINIFPEVDGELSVKKTGSCSPLNSQINLSSSQNIDSIYWTIAYPNKEETKKTELVPFTIYHENESLPDTDTITVNAILKNNYGCQHIAEPLQLFVYPKPEASFKIDTNAGISPFSVIFDNTSVGTNSFLWNFDDNETSVEENPTHTFISTVPDTFMVNLVAILPDCSDTIIKPIIVKPESNSSIHGIANSKIYYFYKKSTEEIVISNQDSSIENLEVSVFNLLGKNVHTSKLDKLNNGSNYTVSISGEPDGIYLIRVFSKNQQYTGKVIKR